jgi:acyl carrier protein
MNSLENIFERVAAVVAKMFNVQVSEITRATTAVDIDGWDSVSHAMLSFELEDEFKLRLEFEHTISLPDLGALAEHIYQKLAEGEAVKIRAADRHSKPLIIVFGNCQAEVIAGHFKNFYPPLSENYDVRYVSSYARPGEPAQPMLSAEELASCAVLLEQRTPYVRFSEASRAHNARTTTFPSLDLNVLWPLHAPDPRNAPRPGLLHGPNPYGDRIINKLVKDGLSGEEAWQAYVQLSDAALSNLPRLLEIERQRWDLMERQTSVTMSDVVFNSLTGQRTHSTFNHPFINIIAELAARILVKAELANGCSGDEMLNRMRTLFRVRFGEELQSPVHPKVARELGLTWWKPDILYNWHGKTLQYEEFIRRQIDWV